MGKRDYAVGLDIGTTKIVVIVGKKNANGKIDIMGFGQSESNGVKDGIVNNIPLVIESILKAVHDAKNMAKVPIKNVVVGIAGKHIRSMQQTDYITREDNDKFITAEDIEDLKAQVYKLVLPTEEQIIHVLPQDFRIDSEGDIYEPIGMHGKRIEANFHVVIGKISNIKNIMRCVQEAGLVMDALTLEPLASAQSVLSSEEKEAGVAIIDIGGGTTDVAIFKDNIIRHTCVIPYAGKIITEDIKTGCSIIERKAEELKKAYGSVDPNAVKENTYVSIPGQYDTPHKEISLKNLAQIISSRYEEIVNLVELELKTYGVNEPKKKLISGLVLTGGGANLQNIRNTTTFLTGFETRIGVSNEYINNDVNKVLKGPEFATSIGLLMEGLQIVEQNNEEMYLQEQSKVQSEEIIANTNESIVTQAAEKNDTILQSTEKKTFGQNILNYINKLGNLFDEKEN